MLLPLIYDPCIVMGGDQIVFQGNQTDNIRNLYRNANEAETLLPKSSSPKDILKLTRLPLANLKIYCQRFVQGLHP